MLLFSLPPKRDAAPGADVPLSPAAYLRLRRKAAGLSVEGAAAAIAPRERDRAEAADLVRMLETEGVRARHRATLDMFASIFPIDVDVYHQLATEPADRHPRICRGCGCSGYDPCTGQDGVCGWATPGACTRCIDDQLSAAEAA